MSQTIGQLLDQTIINAIKVEIYSEEPEPHAPDIARRLETVRGQHRALTLELECLTILALFGLRDHRPFKQAKRYGGQLQ